MKLDLESYEEYFKGYFITDCVVRNKNIIYFVVQQEDDGDDDSPAPMTGIVMCIEKPGAQPWSHVLFKGMRRLLAGVSFVSKEQFVGVTINGRVYSLGSGEKGFEHDLKGVDSKQLKEQNASAEQYLLRGAISKLRTIDGRLYVCGLGRTVIHRIEKNEWHYHLDFPKNKHFLDPVGFEDIDGFSEKDIYAVGGKGDVWHFDGVQWKQIAFPSNMDLWAVCCAGDGEVYIGAESGTVFKGRNNKWKMISRGDMSLPFKDMVWYQGKVWCTSDYGLWVIEKDKVHQADVPASVSSCSGHLSVGDGVMLLAGMYGAALHNGEEWKRIIDYSDFA
ncbi:WD40/YVTN/BNR-like repeat-containing protein [Pseudoduganella sp. S-14]|jgi:hypothetical protein|uniref:WD40/YVTN/BNR-like repeat-containing protein n=1 Tax=Pseudoduganella sp. S-14 TaxID=3404065 RepID=UPI003CED4AA0